MLEKEGPERDDRRDRSLAVCLAVVAGAINAAAFYAAGFFAANMTGNVSAAADHLALGGWAQAGFFLVLIAAFIFGSFVAALSIAAGQRRSSKHIYSVLLFVEAAALAGVGLVAALLPPLFAPTFVVVCVAFLMGLQNALVTRISGARVRTTHISGMATDLGIEVASTWEAWRGRPPAEGADELRRRLSLHALTVLAFFTGGVIGVLIYRELQFGLLVLAGAALAVIAWFGGPRRRR